MFIPLQRHPHCPQLIKSIDPDNIDRMDLPNHQKDGSSCGVFACLYAEALSLGYLPTYIEKMDISKKDIDRYREKLYDVLGHFTADSLL